MTAIANGGSQRLASIDQVRGAVMVLMALDHVRWFFTNISTYQPETLAQTNLSLFLTRWVTHYCAPGFFLLAGIGIFLYGAKVADTRKLQHFLISRGLMLIALELTIVGFSWVFTPGYSFGGVIWSLGWSFIFMAALVRLPRGWLAGLALGVILFHNLLDGVGVAGPGWGLFIWRWLYAPGVTDNYFILFPVVPWLAMMVLGYVLGSWYKKPLAERRRFFIRLGWAAIAAFLMLRVSNLYGNPESLFLSAKTAGDFALQGNLGKTIINLLNVEKYPPSLLFTLMTLGPIFLWLGYSKLDSSGTSPSFFSRAMVLFGRVPLFYYVLHLYLIHLMALA
ncbi:MAG: heparan-alpha-glucosaminide N-acetyltransferase domain-containing protein, partial [Sphingomonadales bacterium]